MKNEKAKSSGDVDNYAVKLLKWSKPKRAYQPAKTVGQAK
jgi:hypothetical protein